MMNRETRVGDALEIPALKRRLGAARRVLKHWSAAFVLVMPLAAWAQEGGVRLDFQDTELRLVLAALAEAGNLNIVYGDLPQRRVTLRMSRAVPREQVPDLLRSVAASNGLRVVEEGGFLRVEAMGAVGPREDSVAAAAELTLYVYRLKHARAPALAGTLQAMFGGSGAGGLAGAQRLSRRGLSRTLRDQQIPPADSVAPEGRRVEAELGDVQVAVPGELSGQVQIVPDQVTNSLLVRAEPADWEILRQTIEALDLRPLQVLIEVLIAEVRRNDDFRLGVSATASGTVKGASVTGELTGTDVGDVALDILKTGAFNLDVAIRALSSRGDVRVLSRPVLLAQNNQEAHILIGAERPFIQVFRSLPTDAAVRDQVVQYRDVGTSVTILPTINADGYVNLQVVQEVSTATAETQFGAPVISTRETSTYLFVKDGQTAVLGGLMDRQEDRRRSGVPVLKDIPLLGALFGTTERITSTAELFVFITPHLVATDDDADRIRRELGDQTQFLRDLLPPDSARVKRVPPR
jgi:general secretion pathway protein D